MCTRSRRWYVTDCWESPLADLPTREVQRAYLGYLATGGYPVFAPLDAPSPRHSASSSAHQPVCAKQVYALVAKLEDTTTPEKHPLGAACLAHLIKSYTVSNIAREAFADVAFVAAHKAVSDGLVRFIVRNQAVMRSPEWEEALQENLTAASATGEKSSAERIRWAGTLLSRIGLAAM